MPGAAGVLPISFFELAAGALYNSESLCECQDGQPGGCIARALLTSDGPVITKNIISTRAHILVSVWQTR